MGRGAPAVLPTRGLGSAASVPPVPSASADRPLRPNCRLSSPSDVTQAFRVFLFRCPDPGRRPWAHPARSSRAPCLRPPHPAAAPCPPGRSYPSGRPRRPLLGALAGFRTSLFRAAVPAAGGGAVTPGTPDGHVPGARARARAPAGGGADRRRGFGRRFQRLLRGAPPCWVRSFTHRGVSIGVKNVPDRVSFMPSRGRPPDFTARSSCRPRRSGLDVCLQPLQKASESRIH